MKNCNLVFVVLAWIDEDARRLQLLTWNHVAIAMAVITAQVGLGPFGVTTIFPNARFWNLFQIIKDGV